MPSSTYSTWEFYHTAYCGALSENVYRQYAFKAKFEINRQTFERAATAPEAMNQQLALCECELLDTIYAYAQIPKGINSINNDGYSASFGNSLEEVAELTRICRKYLTQPYNLLFAGGYIHV